MTVPIMKALIHTLALPLIPFAWAFDYVVIGGGTGFAYSPISFSFLDFH